MSETQNIGQENLNENPSEMKLTVKEAAGFVEETTSVVRNWMRDLKTYIPTKRGDNGYHYFDQPALERLLLIKKLSREQDYSVKQIEHYLATDGKAFKPEPEPDQTEELMKEIRGIKEQLNQQENFNKELLTRLDQQSKYITNSLEKRDEHLVKTMNEMLETKRIAATQEPPEEKKGFFARLFGK